MLVTNEIISSPPKFALPAALLGGLVDVDVAPERTKVAQIFDSKVTNAKQKAVFAHNCCKVYYGRGTAPTKIAVKDVSVVFGLLGANGAGKTTLLKRVSGEEDSSSAEPSSLEHQEDQNKLIQLLSGAKETRYHKRWLCWTFPSLSYTAAPRCCGLQSNIDTCMKRSGVGYGTRPLWLC